MIPEQKVNTLYTSPAKDMIILENDPIYLPSSYYTKVYWNKKTF